MGTWGKSDLVKAGKFPFWLVVVPVLYLALEVLCLCGLIGLREIRHITFRPSLAKISNKALISLLAGESTYVAISPTLGWTLKPNSSYQYYRVNAQGLRGKTNVSKKLSQGKVRLAAFGDSFTFGADVEDKDVWEEKWMQINPKLEILNFGVGGYGLDQAFLRYQQDGVGFHPDVVLIGYMPENIFRHVYVFRAFYMPETRMPFTKPRFVLTDDHLSLLPNPLCTMRDYRHLLADEGSVLPMLGANDFYYQAWYHPGKFDIFPSVRLAKICSAMLRRHRIRAEGLYQPRSEAFRITVKLFEEFYGLVIRNGALPVVAIFPAQADIVRARENKKRTYELLVDALTIRGFRTVDLSDAFQTYGQSYRVEDLIKTHYTPLGNEIVAKYLNNYLAKNGLTDSAVVKAR